MNKGKLIFSAAAIVLAAGVIFYLYYSLESEKNLREDAQTQLAAKVDELAQKESNLKDLEQQKNDQGETLNTKIADLEASLKDSEDKRKELVDKVNILQNDVADRETKIDELTKKYVAIERENLKSLEAKIQPQEIEKSAVTA